MQQRPHPIYLLPFCRRLPNRRQHLSVSLAAAFKGFGVSLQDTTNPVGVIAELTHRLDRERHLLALLIKDAVPADHDYLQEIKLAFLAKLPKFLPTDPLELGVKGSRIEGAAISRLFDRYRPSENLDFFTDKCHA